MPIITNPSSDKTVKKNTWPALARVVLFWLASMLVFAAATRFVGKGSGVISSIYGVAITVVATLLLTFLFTKWQRMPLTETGIVPGPKTLIRLPAGILLGCLLGAAQTIPVLLTGHVRLLMNNEIETNSIILTFVLYSLLACREELVFRGYSLQSLSSASGWALALSFTSLLFIIEHIIGGMPWSVAIWGAGLGSVLFGIAALKSKGLALPIGLHAAWNISQWTLGFKKNEAPFRSVVDKGFENEMELIGSISYIVIIVLAVSLFIISGKRKQT